MVHSGESIVYVEIRATTKSLPEKLGAFFSSKVGSKCLHEDIPGLSAEEVLALIPVVQMVGLSSVEGLHRDTVLGSESVAEVRVQHPAIGVLVVPSDKKVDIVLVREAAEFSESLDQLNTGNEAFGGLVEHLPGVHEVEVWLGGEMDLGILKLLIESHLLSECADKLFHLVVLQRGTSVARNLDLTEVLESVDVSRRGMVSRPVSLVLGVLDQLLGHINSLFIRGWLVALVSRSAERRPM